MESCKNMEHSLDTSRGNTYVVYHDGNRDFLHLEIDIKIQGRPKKKWKVKAGEDLINEILD
jgi:hypothetical protein